ncbi:MAG: hypothetical protein QW761_01325 [Candidatus Aenigmatarchaeota archaeon]
MNKADKAKRPFEDPIDFLILGSRPLLGKILFYGAPTFMLILSIFGFLITYNLGLLIYIVISSLMLYYPYWWYKTFEKANQINDTAKRLKAKERILDINWKIMKYGIGSLGVVVASFIITAIFVSTIMNLMPNLFVDILCLMVWMFFAICLFKLFKYF